MGNVRIIILGFSLSIISNINAQLYKNSNIEFRVDDSLVLFKDTIHYDKKINDSITEFYTGQRRQGFYICNSNSQKRLTVKDSDQLLKGQLSVSKIFSYIMLMDSSDVYIVFNPKDYHIRLMLTYTSRIATSYSYPNSRAPFSKFKSKKIQLYVTYNGDNHFYSYKFTKKKDTIRVKRKRTKLFVMSKKRLKERERLEQHYNKLSLNLPKKACQINGN